MVSGRPILTVGDDVDAFRRVFGEDNVARLTREKICYRLARGFIVLSRLLGQAVRSPSVVTSIAKEVPFIASTVGFGVWLVEALSRYTKCSRTGKSFRIACMSYIENK